MAAFFIMKISIPQNIFARLLVNSLPAFERFEVEPAQSAMIVQAVEKGESELGIIPAFDLLQHSELFVSNKIGISFDGPLSNSYLYFKPSQRNIDKLFLTGDVSTNEIILSKIILLEKFGVNISPQLTAEIKEFDKENYLVVGNENFQDMLLEKGVSFSEIIAEYIDYPYVNFVLVSKNKMLLEEISNFEKKVDETIEDNLAEYLSGLDLSQNAKNFITENFDSVYFEITGNEITGLSELLRLAYYHGIVKEITEINLT